MWKKVEYTKKEINEAGRRIIDKNLTEEERQHYLEIIDNWRAAHAFPTNTFAMNLKRKVEKIPGAFVVQRLKRLDTIVKKLERFPKMELYRMQDLGGCRVVVPTIKDVYSLVTELRYSRMRHEEHNYKDYISSPNPKTGYRGYHLIYRYKSDKNDTYNGLQVEIQIRTYLQHLWATAVETVGLFTDNDLKFNKGSQDWLDFFQLTSILFAINEMNVTEEELGVDLIRALRPWARLLKKLDVIPTLGSIGIATYRLGHIQKKYKNCKGYYLITLSFDTKRVQVTVFKNAERATDAYNKFENENTNTKNSGVLVSAQSYETLVTAYPNYFLNITDFFEEVQKLLEQYRAKLDELQNGDSKG